MGPPPPRSWARWPARGGRFDRDRPIVTEAVARIQAHAAATLAHQRRHLVTIARGRTHKAAGADDDDKEDALLDAVAAIDYNALGDAIRPVLVSVSQDAARLGLQQVGADELDALLSQANDRAVEWATRRAGELVTQVTATTRQAVADLTAEALREGWSNDQLAEALDSSDAFGDLRAELIARTETAMADVQGNVIGWRESGVVRGKEWLVADANECDDCAELAGKVVPLDEEFEEGDPPLHPRCRCDLLPVLMDSAVEE